MAIRDIEEAIHAIEEKFNVKAYDVGGVKVFPFYAVSGGLSCVCLCYFLRPGVTPHHCDMGREYAHKEGIVPIEFEYCWTPDQIMKHAEEILGGNSHQTVA